MSWTSPTCSLPLLSICLRRGVVSGLLTAALALAPLVSAQPYQRNSHSPTYQSQESPRPSGTRLPGWAEPQAHRKRQGRAAPSSPNEASRNSITNPSNPNRVPLGGLEWLLAAGLGYGAYRLRGQGDDDAAA
jgi:hypothetical protein